jgi:hypothetical protein
MSQGTYEQIEECAKAAHNAFRKAGIENGVLNIPAWEHCPEGHRQEVRDDVKQALLNPDEQVLNPVLLHLIDGFRDAFLIKIAPEEIPS